MYLILIPTAILLALAIAYLLVAHRYYLSSSRMELNTNNTTFGLDHSADSAGMADSLQVNSLLQTQAQILQSEAIDLRVIRDLNLEQTPAFKSADTPPPGQGPPLESSPKRLDHVLSVFTRNLSVQVVPSTHLIDVRYTDRDPQRAADIVNHIVQSAVSYNYQTRDSATSKVTGFLSDELSALRKRSEDLQARVLSMQQQGGVISSNAVDAQGHPENYSPALDRVRGASEQLLQAESNAILKKAIYDVAKDGNAEAISTLSGTALASSSPGVNSSFTALQNLRAQEAALEQQLDQARTKYGARFPRLVELQSSLDGIQRAIKDETQRISERAENDYKIAKVTEDADRRIYDEARGDAVNLNGKAAEYDLLRQEADQSRKLYEDLLGHVQEAGILQGLHASTLTMVDVARPSSKPSRPNVPAVLAAGLLCGLFFGLVGAFAAETVGDRIVSPQIVRSEAGAPIAVLPAFAGQLPSERFADTVRTLRTHILASPEFAATRVFLVTSSVTGEGKSVVALQLARALAQNRRRVLLVDANLRHPVIAGRLDAQSSTGLADLLASSSATPLLLSVSDAPLLSVLPAGNASSSPADLLDAPALSERLLQWREQYDFIVLDSPAVLCCSETLRLASLSDHSLVIVRESAVSRTQLRAALNTLLGVTPADRISTVVNAARSGAHA